LQQKVVTINKAMKKGGTLGGLSNMLKGLSMKELRLETPAIANYTTALVLQLFFNSPRSIDKGVLYYAIHTHSKQHPCIPTYDNAVALLFQSQSETVVDVIPTSYVGQYKYEHYRYILILTITTSTKSSSSSA
jgi:hypothetical protein